MITPEKLAEWEQLAEKATPGPWLQYIEDGTPTSYVCVGRLKDSEELIHAYDGPHDSQFIATARTALPEAIAEIRRLQAELQRPQPQEAK